MLQFSQFVWALRYSVWDVVNNFLLIDATDRSRISSDQKRFFIALSPYPLSFFANTPFKLHWSWYNIYYSTTSLKIGGTPWNAVSDDVCKFQRKKYWRLNLIFDKIVKDVTELTTADLLETILQENEERRRNKTTFHPVPNSLIIERWCPEHGSTHLQSVSFTINLTCYPLTFYEFPCSRSHLCSGLTCSGHTCSPAKLAIKTFALQSQLQSKLICYPKL